MIHSLSSKTDAELGGSRIEVTVKASTLQDASSLVRHTPFLDLSYWLGARDGPHAHHRLSAKTVTKEGLLANANWVYAKATNGEIFMGRGADKPTPNQIKALSDVFNALGWNAGLRRPTKSLDWHA